MIGNYVEFPIKQKHFVQTMRTRTRRNDCFAIVLGADKKDVLLMILSARVCDNTLSCLIGNCDEFPIKQKTLRKDATRCMWNMSAKADCIWRAKRNKSLKD